MKTRTRRQFTADFKTKLVLQVLRQEQTLNQIASANDIHPKQLQTASAARLEQTFLAAAPTVFDEQKRTEKPATDESGPLYEQIGRLQMELTAPAARLAQKKIGDFPMSQRRAIRVAGAAGTRSFTA